MKSTMHPENLHLAPPQHEVVCGALLSGGTLTKPSESEAVFRVRFKTPQSASFFHSHLIEFGDVYEDDGEYVWESEPHTDFSRYHEDWVGEGGDIRIPSGFSPEPYSLRIAYSRIGRVEVLQGKPTPVLDHERFPGGKEAVDQVFSDWHPLMFENMYTGKGEVYLQGKEEFYANVTPEPVPGQKDRWPGEYYQHSLVEDASGECHTCTKNVSNLDAHWYSSPICQPPVPTSEEGDALAGVLLAGGRVRRGAHGTYVAVMADNKEVLEWLDEKLSRLGRGVEPSPCESGMYIWRSHELTDADFLNEWESPVWFEETAATVPESIRQSKTTIRVAYALSGESRSDHFFLNVDHEYTSESAVRSVFRGFLPLVTEDGVEIHDTNEFFGFIGKRPVRGCSHKWSAAGASDNQSGRRKAANQPSTE